jgi:hypothetical protein
MHAPSAVRVGECQAFVEGGEPGLGFLKVLGGEILGMIARSVCVIWSRTLVLIVVANENISRTQPFGKDVYFRVTKIGVDTLMGFDVLPRDVFGKTLSASPGFELYKGPVIRQIPTTRTYSSSVRNTSINHFWKRTLRIRCAAPSY